MPLPRVNGWIEMGGAAGVVAGLVLGAYLHDHSWSYRFPVAVAATACLYLVAAVTALPGVVFSGSVDGHLRAYATGDGKIVWDFDTAREFKTVNGVPGRGGAMDAGGPVVDGGMVFAGAGYGNWGGLPGKNGARPPYWALVPSTSPPTGLEDVAYAA